MEYKSFAAGYLVKDGKVLLAHHVKFDRWVPPGGHIEPNETPAEAVVREFLEETGLVVEAVSAVPLAYEGDPLTTPVPVPFHIEVEAEGFSTPHIGYFYFVRLAENAGEQVHQEAEVKELRWFTPEELSAVPTFDNSKKLVPFALANHPQK